MEYKIKTLEKLLKKLKTEMYINRKSSGLKQDEIDALEVAIKILKNDNIYENLDGLSIKELDSLGMEYALKVVCIKRKTKELLDKLETDKKSKKLNIKPFKL